MTDKSIFTDKSTIPDENRLIESLGDTYLMWKMIKEYALLNDINSIEEWNYPGEKYGWSFRIKDKKRAILYLLPREKSFKVAFVFGQKEDANAKLQEANKAAMEA